LRDHRLSALVAHRPAHQLASANHAESPGVITAIFQLVNLLITMYIWALILSAVISTLIAFNILDTRNRLVWTIGDFLYRVTDPVLRPIRNMLPNLGGIDISPLIVIVVLQYLVRPLLGSLYGAIVYGAWRPLVF
jgi:YggT family protein